MESLPDELYVELMLRLGREQLDKFCQVDSHIHNICQSDYFIRRRLKYEFPIEADKYLSTSVPRELYRRLRAKADFLDRIRADYDTMVYLDSNDTPFSYTIYGNTYKLIPTIRINLSGDKLLIRRYAHNIGQMIPIERPISQLDSILKRYRSVGLIPVKNLTLSDAEVAEGIRNGLLTYRNL